MNNIFTKLNEVISADINEIQRKSENEMSCVARQIQMSTGYCVIPEHIIQISRIELENNIVCTYAAKIETDKTFVITFKAGPNSSNWELQGNTLEW